LPNSARERKWRPSIPAHPADHRRIRLTRLPQRFVPEVTEVRFRQAVISLTGFARLFHVYLIPAMPCSAMQDFGIFHTIPGRG
jgi:hypothetical protein